MSLAARRGARTTLLAVCLAALAVAVFLPVRRLGFVWDDYDYLHYNPLYAAGASLAAAGRSFVTFHSANWHPVTWISHLADLALFGTAPAGHHVVNLLLHAANAALLFVLLAALTGRPWPAAAVAALFAVHPLRVESVAWVSQRKDLLAALFGICTLLSYARRLRSPRRGRGTAAFVFLALALAAKPTAVTVPLLMLVLDWWPLGRVRSAGGWRPLLHEKLPFAVLAAGAAALALAAQSAAGAIDPSPFPARLANALRSSVVYLANAAWPADLVAFYPLRDVPFPVAAGSAALLALFTAAALGARRRQPWLLAGWLWYLVALLPVIGLVQVGAQAMADRYTYLPQVGIAVAIVWTAAAASGRHRVPAVVPAGLAAAAVVALALATRALIPSWHDEVALWSRAERRFPGTQRIALNLGLALREQGDVPGAERRLREAVRTGPNDRRALAGLGSLLVDTGREAEALPLLERAVQAGAADAAAALGRARERDGDVAGAIAHYRHAAGIDPTFVPAYNNLGVLLASQGDLAGAVSAFRAALGLRPRDPIALRNLARALELQGDLAGALSAYEAALRAEPESAETRAMRDRARRLLAAAPGAGR